MITALCTIVGMGRGISNAVARRFAREGFRIGMISRDAGGLREFENEIPGARGIVADAGDEAALRAGVRDLGPARVLVYNASAGHAGPPSQLNTADALADFRVNILGVLAAVQEIAPAMRDAGSGTIFITGGGLALSPMATLASLSLGKAAQRNLAFSLGEELEPAGIHVATITVCGFVRPGTRFAAANIAEEFWRLHAQPIGHFEREVVIK
jgi:short-subunit dehydrogenase